MVVTHQLLGISGDRKDSTPTKLDIWTKVEGKLTYELPEHDIVLNTTEHHQHRVKWIGAVLRHIEKKLGNEKFGTHLKGISDCVGFKGKNYILILAPFGTSPKRIQELDEVTSTDGELIIVL
ncbi:hypothetical protein LMH87_001477 [Akanthomyces muscarius]|uniref:Uncharacterized protein n=1 Tax=Akanthomyces muscarius TaxID=2231603 RepID=A0A9W8Q569_AKAMU|nr:hypothetical protein LMH87_001477 [Akanthomyces muscarius]KAJ4146922.1 hypothetical protein LMH87_001477 [Akanthomyces muscarius]